MEKRDPHNCLEFDFAYANGTVIRFKDGRWGRVVSAPMKDHPEVEQTRYTIIERCPWCNKRLRSLP